MNIKTHILSASGKLDPFRELIDKTAKEAIGKVTQKIPVDNVDIVFNDSKISAIPHLGLGGYTATKNLIMISIDPEFANIKSSIDENLGGTLAHELYHCLRGYAYDSNKKSTLLGSIINEGLADHFDLEITGNKPSKWSTALGQTEINKFFKLAEKEFKSKNYNHYAWFFGSKEKGIPKWTGYSLGFYLVEQYFKKYPHLKASIVYNMKAEDF